MLSKNPGWILETVQSNEIAGTKRNILLYKGKNSKDLQMESMQHVSLSGERGGPSKMVESRMLYVRAKDSRLKLCVRF